MMAGEKPKEKHAMKYGCVLPLSGIERAFEQLVEYAHIAKEEGREGGVPGKLHHLLGRIG